MESSQREDNIESAKNLLNLEESLKKIDVPTDSTKLELVNDMPKLESTSKEEEHDEPKKKVKTNKELKQDIRELENALKIENKKSLSKMVKVELELYLSELLQKASETIQLNEVSPDTKNDTPTDTKTEIEQPVETNPIRELKEDLKQEIRDNIQQKKRDLSADEVNSQALFRLNMVLLFAAEGLSKPMEEKFSTNLKGAATKLKEDYERDDTLKNIYLRVYLENKATISQYLSPMTELALYNVSLISSVAANNLDQKKKNS